MLWSIYASGYEKVLVRCLYERIANVVVFIDCLSGMGEKPLPLLPGEFPRNPEGAGDPNDYLIRLAQDEEDRSLYEASEARYSPDLTTITEYTERTEEIETNPTPKASMSTIRPPRATQEDRRVSLASEQPRVSLSFASTSDYGQVIGKTVSYHFTL